MSSSEILEKAELILAKAKELQDDDNFRARMDLVHQVDGLYRALEPPVNTFFKQWSSMTVLTCLNIAVKLGILEQMKDRESTTAQQLSELVHVDASAIARALRVLVAAGIVVSTGEDSYAHTAKSLVFVQGEKTAVHSFAWLTFLSASYITLPDYLKTRPAEDLLDIRKTPYACAYGMEGKTFYEALSANPDILANFNKAMSQTAPEYGIFPFASLREEVEAERERVFVVDVGGGRGQALRFIQKEVGSVFATPPKLVLQDRPEVLAELSSRDVIGIEAMSYDFYTEQPVKGAHIYYLSKVLHNYPDHLCRDILKRIAAAMGHGSRLLIAETVLPAQPEAGKGMAGYVVDIVGLATGGKERTEKEFTSLLGSEGLDLVRVWRSKTSLQSVVEARLKSL